MDSQTSGSINLDMSGMAAAVVTALEPVLAQVNANLTRLAGLLASTALDEQAAVDVLSGHGACVLSQAEARSLAASLARSGYALVAVTGAALEAEVERMGIETALPAEVEEIVNPVAAQADREDAWFTPGRED